MVVFTGSAECVKVEVMIPFTWKSGASFPSHFLSNIKPWIKKADRFIKLSGVSLYTDGLKGVVSTAPEFDYSRLRKGFVETLILTNKRAESRLKQASLFLSMNLFRDLTEHAFIWEQNAAWNRRVYFFLAEFMFRDFAEHAFIWEQKAGWNRRVYFFLWIYVSRFSRSCFQVEFL